MLLCRLLTAHGLIALWWQFCCSCSRLQWAHAWILQQQRAASMGAHAAKITASHPLLDMKSRVLQGRISQPLIQR